MLSTASLSYVDRILIFASIRSGKDRYNIIFSAAENIKDGVIHGKSDLADFTRFRFQRSCSAFTKT